MVFTKEITRTYEVGVDKAYFPKNLCPRDTTCVFDRVEVKATSRENAAHEAWKLHGDKWLDQMNPKMTSVRKISLHVNDPSAGVGGKLGRLSTIQVYED